MRPFPRFAAAILLAGLAVPSVSVRAQIQNPGKLNELYAQTCANCHGANMEGASAPSMLDDVWVHGGDDESIAASIRHGYPEKGMPAWSAALSEKDIRSMVIFIRERRAKAQQEHSTIAKPAESISVQSQHHAYTLNTWVSGLSDPWSLAFLPGKEALVTEKRGRFFLITDGKLSSTPITGLPAIDTGGQAGLFDVVPHPDYAKNGWIYLSYSHPQTNAEGKSVSLTRIIRGKLKDGAWVEQQTIFEAPIAAYPAAGGLHFGGRIAFDKAGYLYFTIGERGKMANAQNLTLPTGKVHRLFDDGCVPTDNPFVNDPTADHTIWSYGHRNPQGLAVHPATGAVYDAEHGPRGGDEVNLIRPGRNYGWPLITYGMDYDGSPINGGITAKEGLEQPINYWVPSIAPCGINFYTGELFPKWKNDLFVASLAAQELQRLRIDGDKVVEKEILFKGLGRIRDVITGPDGALYVLLPDRIARITPAQ